MPGSENVHKLLTDALRLRFLYATRYEFEPAWHMEPRLLPYSVLWLILKGPLLLTVNRGSYAGETGQILFLPQQSHISCSASGASRIVLITIRFEAEIHNIKDRIWSDLLHVPIQFPYSTNELAPLFYEMYELYRRPGIGKSLLLQASLLKLIGLMMEQLYPYVSPEESGSRLEPRIQTIARFLVAHPGTVPAFQDLCRLVQLSESHLRELFYKHTGLSPTQYIQRIKMDQAQKLLLESDDRVGDIALKLGYENANYFSRLFKKWTRHTPQEFRSQNRLI